ncbi:helix-turn-helix domain-containing protein [Virgibacillus salexigens]|uniref:helix-turn-helix domain-containing protein n=1 Tax=Virgibacillus salexigens TaxID=61016 RepID=UPI001F36220D|nr:helix-turn-helix domain-containing protein [Virgibacillus salexigens]
MVFGMEIGARLKEAREAKNLSLESLQETTKIQKRYLIAIEEGNLHILPGKFYARAFIKEYANAVGVDPDELMEEFKEEVPKTEEPTEEHYSRMQRSRKNNNTDKPSSNFSLFPTVIVVLLIVGIILVAVFFISQSMFGKGENEPINQDGDEDVIINDDTSQTQDSETASDENEENKDSAANEKSEDASIDDEASQEETEPKGEFSTVEKGTGNTPESIVAYNYAGEEVTATLEAEGDTWLGVKSESDEIFFEEAMFNEEKSPLEIDLTGQERVFFKIGNASVLTITVNGVEMEYPVDSSTVRQNIWIELNQEAE